MYIFMLKVGTEKITLGVINRDLIISTNLLNLMNFCMLIYNLDVYFYAQI